MRVACDRRHSVQNARHQITGGESGTADHATVENTTHIAGLTIENCVVGILIQAGVSRVVLLVPQGRG